jgi:hypothetical protein
VNLFSHLRTALNRETFSRRLSRDSRLSQFPMRVPCLRTPRNSSMTGSRNKLARDLLQ